MQIGGGTGWAADRLQAMPLMSGIGPPRAPMRGHRRLRLPYGMEVIRRKPAAGEAAELWQLAVAPGSASSSTFDMLTFAGSPDGASVIMVTLRWHVNGWETIWPAMKTVTAQRGRWQTQWQNVEWEPKATSGQVFAGPAARPPPAGSVEASSSLGLVFIQAGDAGAASDVGAKHHSPENRRNTTAGVGMRRRWYGRCRKVYVRGKTSSIAIEGLI